MYKRQTEYSAKVGLMYASDYGFAAASSAWTTILDDYESANWMYLGAIEWTISRLANDSSRAFSVYPRGSVGGGQLNIVSYAHGVRPVFNLSSSVNYVSGSGTAADPISIN